MTHASKHGHGERHSRKRARAVLSRAGYNAGGHITKKVVGEMVRKGVGEHEDNDHKGKKRTHLKLKSGGVADGMIAKPRADRRRHKGKGGKGGHHVTIVNVGAQKQPMPIPVPKPVPVPAGGPPGMSAGAPMPPPKPPMAGGGPPGMPMPGGLKHGGRARRKDGGKTPYPIDDGADSGEGRLEKARAYGAKTHKR